MQRRQFLKSTSVALAATLSGCGGGDSGGAAPSDASPPPPGPAPAPAPAPGSAGSFGGLPTLTLHSTQSAVGPYTAAVFPLQGLVPSGQGIDSPDDPAVRSTVISRWPDGSASVVVVAGETSVSPGASKQIRLRAAAAGSTPLTPARIGQLVSNVTVNFGAVGSAVFDNLATPSKVWWANERVICCRYRAPIGAHPTLEAVVDIHAFSSNRALVEVVVENCKMATSSPTQPPSISYTATVSVNGASVTTVQSAGAPGGTHQPFRAWYSSSWVGGDPGIGVTHDTASMQAHPLFFRTWKSGGSMAEYAADTYQPWGVGRHPASGMGGPGDSAFIGPLPKWEVQYLQTGDNQARRAVIASALSVLTFNVNYRDSGTGLVPTFDQLANKNQQLVGSDAARAWPNTGGAEPAWEVAHHPAAGLLAFMCRPSPAFIEIAQKIAVWNGTWSSDDGSFGTYYQTRGKAWCIRSLAHAIFLTPDADPWKQAGRSALFRSVRLLKTFQDDSKSALGFVWDYSPGYVHDYVGVYGGTGFIQPLWEHHYLVTELHKVAGAQLLAGAEQSALVAMADWAAAQPIRYINESNGGEWRILYYLTPAGRSGTTIDSMSNWGQQFAWRYGAAPPVSGPWMTGNWTAASYAAANIENSAGAYYPSYFWAALVAAVERRLTGADAAWTKVTTNVTNLSTWSAGFGSDPRWGAYPRNK